MKKKLFLLLVVAFGWGITATNAQVRRRAVHQQQRIHQGVKSGELTRHEAAQLHHNERDTRHDIRAARADGRITKSERKDIRQDERKNSRAIYRKKHNLRTR